MTYRDMSSEEMRGLLLEDLEFLLLKPPCRICGWGRPYEPQPHPQDHTPEPLDKISEVQTYWEIYRAEMVGPPEPTAEFRLRMVR